MYICILHACLVAVEKTIGCQIPWNWSDTGLPVTVQVLGTELRLSENAASIPATELSLSPKCFSFMESIFVSFDIYNHFYT